jgi:hypothetical protein
MPPTDVGDPRRAPPIESRTDEPPTLIHGATPTLPEGLGEDPTGSASLILLGGEEDIRDKHATNPRREPFNEQSERHDPLLRTPALALTEASGERAKTPSRPSNVVPSAHDRSSLKSTPSNRGTAALSHVVEETRCVKPLLLSYRLLLTIPSRVGDLEAYFAKDLQSAKECPVEKMLLCLFSRVCRRKTKEPSIYDMYEKVRSEVLNVCNTTLPYEIREHMEN